jgi:hypothetical protein
VFRQRQKPAEATRSNSNCAMASPLRSLPAQLSHAARTDAKRERKQRKRKAARANKRARADGDEAPPPAAGDNSDSNFDVKRARRRLRRRRLVDCGRCCGLAISAPQKAISR